MMSNTDGNLVGIGLSHPYSCYQSGGGTEVLKGRTFSTLLLLYDLLRIDCGGPLWAVPEFVFKRKRLIPVLHQLLAIKKLKMC